MKCFGASSSGASASPAVLKSLSIRNFAVIESLDLEFGPALNVLTGETGAGKSIVVEALGFLAGARGSASWLRTGADRLSVAGVFEASDFPKTQRAQYRLGPGPVEARRELDAAGRTRAWIQGHGVPVAALAAFGESLIDFHGQHEQQALLRPAVQLACVDRYGQLETAAASAAAAWEEWSRLEAESEALQLSDEERRRRIELCRWQWDEIREAGLSPGEEEQIAAALPRLKNAERLATLAASAREVLFEAEGSVQEGLLKASRAVAELVKIDPDLKPLQDCLESAGISVEEVARDLGAYGERVTADPQKLDELVGRLDLIARLKRKYGSTLEEVLDKGRTLARELEVLEHSTERAGAVAAELEAGRRRLAALCESLHKERLAAARKLEKAASKDLGGLGMGQAKFAIAVEFEEGRFTRSGGDDVEFLIAPNPGEPLKALRAVASGGELSRVMLALKTVLSRAEGARVLIFDEVDAGIGGTVGRAVGERLARLGESRQVLCVTHLPQVACFAGRHFEVAKEVREGRTLVSARRLESDARLESLARMLGGREATAASRRHARELLQHSSEPAAVGRAQ